MGILNSLKNLIFGEDTEDYASALISAMGSDHSQLYTNDCTHSKDKKHKFVETDWGVTNDLIITNYRCELCGKKIKTSGLI